MWQGEYDAFGEISITNNQIPQPLRFAGQYHDSESNLYYNWHRYYNPKLGRYISSDPIGILPGLYRWNYRPVPYHIKKYFAGMTTNGVLMEGLNHIYGYVSANPLAYTDIFGLAADCKYYDTRCDEDGGPYYCKAAPLLCGKWPGGLKPPFSDDDFVDCARKCLQNKDYQCDPTPGQCSDEGIDTVCNARIHKECWLECF